LKKIAIVGVSSKIAFNSSRQHSKLKILSLLSKPLYNSHKENTSCDDFHERQKYKVKKTQQRKVH
jgi:hypothetical protein